MPSGRNTGMMKGTCPEGDRQNSMLAMCGRSRSMHRQRSVAQSSRLAGRLAGEVHAPLLQARPQPHHNHQQDEGAQHHAQGGDAVKEHLARRRARVDAIVQISSRMRSPPASSSGSRATRRPQHCMPAHAARDCSVQPANTSAQHLRQLLVHAALVLGEAVQDAAGGGGVEEGQRRAQHLGQRGRRRQ